MSQALLKAEARIVRFISSDCNETPSPRHTMFGERILARRVGLRPVLANELPVYVVFVPRRERPTASSVWVLFPFCWRAECREGGFVFRKFAIINRDLDIAEVWDGGDSIEEIGHLDDG